MAEINYPLTDENIEKIEPRFIQHFSKKEIGEDIHLVRELIRFKDGKQLDNIRLIKDYKRPFWITKPHFRNHKERKEAESIKKVDRFYATQSDLAKHISIRLGGQYSNITNLRRLRKSPYIYGIDVDSTVFLNYKYRKKYGEPTTPYRVGTFDIEVNILTNEIIIATFATYKSIHTYILKSFVKNIPNPVERIKKMYDKYIPEHTLGDLKLDIRIFDNELDMLKEIFRTANNADIDFLAIWNIDYDIPTIVERVKELGGEPVDIFHYKKIPEEYKYFVYKRGKKQKVTESGRVIPINPEEQWHTVKATTNFYFIDAMSAHRYVRVGGKNVPGGYSLDNILKHEGVAKKLKFDSNIGLEGREWHIYMVENRPIEYIIYNMWDAMSMLELDKKTKDLTVSVPLLTGVSHFDNFNSQPKRLVDDFLFFYLEKGMVLGSKPGEFDDDKLLGLGDWIVTMPGYRIMDNGVKIIKELPKDTTNIRFFVFDADRNYNVSLV